MKKKVATKARPKSKATVILKVDRKIYDEYKKRTRASGDGVMKRNPLLFEMAIKKDAGIR